MGPLGPQTSHFDNAAVICLVEDSSLKANLQFLKSFPTMKMGTDEKLYISLELGQFLG